MSNDWPRGWYSDEPDQPGGAGQRPQPNFTPAGPQGQRPPERGWSAPGNAAGGGQRDPAGPGPGNRTAWPAQPPSRSRTGGGGGGYRRRGWRRWLRPRRILAILAGLIALIIVAAVAVYFSVNSKLTKVDALYPTSFTSAGTNWLITGSDSRAGLSRAEREPASPRA